MSSIPASENRFGLEPPADTSVLNAAEDEESLVDLALEQLEPVGAAMSVAKSFIDFSDRFVSLSLERRSELARYFEGLGRGYAEIASGLRTGPSPEGACATVQQHAKQLQKVFDGILTPEESLILVGRLRSLRSADRFQTEMERASFEGEAGRDYELRRLDKAASLVTELGQSLQTAH